jgi:hypothetical protein
LFRLKRKVKYLMLTKNELELTYNGDCLGEMLEALDELHTAASDDTLHTHTTMSRHELVAMLREMIYTAQETITEIEQSAQKTARKQGKRGAVREAAGMAGTPAAPQAHNIIPFVMKESAQERHA